MRDQQSRPALATLSSATFPGMLMPMAPTIHSSAPIPDGRTQAAAAIRSLAGQAALRIQQVLTTPSLDGMPEDSMMLGMQTLFLAHRQVSLTQAPPAIPSLAHLQARLTPPATQIPSWAILREGQTQPAAITTLLAGEPDKVIPRVTSTILS